MNENEEIKECHSFTFKLCDDVFDIVIREQTNALLCRKFRGRNQIINRIIREWDQLKRDRKDSGTEDSETGKT